MSFAFLVRAYYIARVISALINWNRTPPTKSPNFPHDDTYTGETNSKGEPHGQGTATYADGSTYTGEFKDGKRHGQGTDTWPNGYKYTGEWKDNKYNGQGTATYADGRTYSGEWKDGWPVP